MWCHNLCATSHRCYIKWNRVFSMICFGLYDRLWLHLNMHTSLLYSRQKQYVKRAVFPNSQYSQNSRQRVPRWPTTSNEILKLAPNGQFTTSWGQRRGLAVKKVAGRSQNNDNIWQISALILYTVGLTFFNGLLRVCDFSHIQYHIVIIMGCPPPPSLPLDGCSPW